MTSATVATARPRPAIDVRRPVAPTALVGILVLALAWASLAFASAPTDPAGLIAYVDLEGRAALVDPAGGERLAVYDGGLERAQFPAWSSDGNRLAVIVSDMAGGRVDVVDVAAGGEPVTAYRRVGRAPIYLSWAPGDRLLAVLANDAGGGLALDLVEVARALDGDADAVRDFARGAPFYWAWARSGRALLVHQNVLGPARAVGISGVDAFELRTRLPAAGAFQAPAFSPSERYLAYASVDQEAGRRVEVVPNPERPDPTATARSLPHRGVAAFAWRPGREQLAVQGPAVPSPHAFGPVDLLDVASGRVTRLSDDQVVASWWSPDGRWLATLSPVGGGGERTMLVSATGARAIAETAVPAQRRAPALYSLKAIDADTLETRLLGAFAPSPLFLAQHLPFFDQYARSHRLWSPDSDALVLPALDDAGVPTIVVFGIDGSVLPLAQGDMPAWNVR